MRGFLNVAIIAAVMTGGAFLNVRAFASDAASNSTLRLRHVSSWPGHGRGAVYSLALEGDKAFYTASGGGVVVLDVSDPSRMRPIGAIRIYDPAHRIVVNGSRAYVGSPLAFDAFEVDQLPFVTWHGGASMNGWEDFLECIQVVATNAFVGSRFGMSIYNVADPREMVRLGNFESKGYVTRLQVRDGIAFVVDDLVGLHVVDVRKEIRPLLLSSITNTAGPFFPQDPDLFSIQDVAVENGYAFLGGGAAGVLVVDVNDLRNPKIVKTVKASTAAYLVKIAGGLCVVSDRAGSISVIDISNPLEAAVIGSYKEPRFIECNDLQVRDGYAYLAVRDGVISFDIRTPTEPRKIGSYRQVEGQALQVQKVGNYAFVADREGGVGVLDVSDVKQPREVSRYMAPGFDAYEVKVEGDRAYVAGGYSGLKVLDVSDPTRIRQIGAAATGGPAHSLTTRSNMVYAGTEVGLEVWDFSNVAAPKRVMRAGQNPVVDVDLYKNNVFSVEGADVFKVYYVRGTNISELASETMFDPQGVKVHGDRAYLAAGWGGLKVYDANDIKTRGAYERFTTTNGFSHDFDASGDLGVLADGLSVRLLDLSNATNLVELDRFAFFGNAVSATINGTNVFVSTERWGVEIFEIVPPAQMKMPVVLNGIMQLRWEPSGARLEQSTDLELNRWEHVPTPADATTIDLPISGRAEFYRLLEN
ncbi:MAG TPA: hypothetical protein VF773_06795 [Verrucomicrobiae bacterium]